jgi:NitT/TauT family transport system permease protein
MTQSLDAAFAAIRTEAVARPLSVSEADIKSSLAVKARAARRRWLIILLGQILIPALFFALWEFASRSGWLQNAEAFYSKPSSIAAFLADDAVDLMWQTWATMQAVVLGGGMGMILGGLAGLLLGRLDTLNRMLDPSITVLAGLPRIALAPIFLLWFGITLWAKVFLSFSIVFFIMLINIRAGVKTVDPELQTAARLLGARPGQMFRHILLPAIVPVMFGSLRLAVVFSVLGVIASEMITARDGLGIAIVKYSQTLEPAGVFAVLAILAVLMSAISAVIGRFEARAMSWYKE